MDEMTDDVNKSSISVGWIAAGFVVVALLVGIGLIASRANTADPQTREPTVTTTRTPATEAVAPVPVRGEFRAFVVDNGVTDTLQRLTASHFTPETGIVVDFFELPEQELRERFTVGFLSTQAEADVMMFGSQETTQLGGIDSFFRDLTHSPRQTQATTSTTSSGRSVKPTA